MLCVIIPGAVVLFLLLVIATPSFIRARKQSRRNVCLDNSRQIDGSTGSCTVEYSKKRGDEVEKLAPGAPVIISVAGASQHQHLEVVLDEQGFVDLPSLGRINAKGMTTSELSKAITNAYSSNDTLRAVTVLVTTPERGHLGKEEAEVPGIYFMLGENRAESKEHKQDDTGQQTPSEIPSKAGP